MVPLAKLRYSFGEIQVSFRPSEVICYSLEPVLENWVRLPIFRLLDFIIVLDLQFGKTIVDSEVPLVVVPLQDINA